jgi:hypothetical protein
MKRSEVLNKISDNVLINFFPTMLQIERNLIADAVLTEVEKLGMKLTNLDGEVEPHEPEEGWDAYFAEQERKELQRDFKIILHENEFKTTCYNMAELFLDGYSIEAIAQDYNVTRERVKQCIAKVRKRYQRSIE